MRCIIGEINSPGLGWGLQTSKKYHPTKWGDIGIESASISFWPQSSFLYTSRASSSEEGGVLYSLTHLSYESTVHSIHLDSETGARNRVLVKRKKRLIRASFFDIISLTPYLPTVQDGRTGVLYIKFSKIKKFLYLPLRPVSPIHQLAHTSGNFSQLDSNGDRSLLEQTNKKYHPTKWGDMKNYWKSCFQWFLYLKIERIIISSSTTS